jgi:hypothetical protein
MANNLVDMDHLSFLLCGCSVASYSNCQKNNHLTLNIVSWEVSKELAFSWIKIRSRRQTNVRWQVQSTESKVQAERQVWESERAAWEARENSFLSKHEQLERDHKVYLRAILVLRVNSYFYSIFQVTFSLMRIPFKNFKRWFCFPSCLVKYYSPLPKLLILSTKVFVPN